VVQVNTQNTQKGNRTFFDFYIEEKNSIFDKKVPSNRIKSLFLFWQKIIIFFLKKLYCVKYNLRFTAQPRTFHELSEYRGGDGYNSLQFMEYSDNSKTRGVIVRLLDEFSDNLRVALTDPTTATFFILQYRGGYKSQK
jgi:hypothetical protein